MSKDLRQFLKQVKEAGADYYAEVKKPLKPELEKDVLQLKLSQSGRYPLIYCPKVEGSQLPLVSNVFGSYELMGMAMDLNPGTANKSDVLREFRKRKDNRKPVKEVPASEAPVKEVILRGKDVDLGLLPINFHAKLNSAKFVTIGQMICRNPDTGITNTGVYRHEVKGKDKLGVMLVSAHNSAYIARRHAELGKPMQVAIFIGHHPATVLASIQTISIDINGLEAIGGLMSEPLRVTPAETVDLPVPADAEIVLEGTIDTRNMVTDGPFSEWEGYYGIPLKCYLIQISCITMRKDAIYHDLAPSQREHQLAGVLGFTSSVYDGVKRVVPTVKEAYLPLSGCGNITAYVSIAKRVAGEGMRAGIAAVNALSAAKLAVVVDDDIDVYNEEEVMWAVATRMSADRGVSILPGVLGDPLSPTSYDESRAKRGQMITKMIIDATKPVESPFPVKVTAPPELWSSMKLEDYIK